MILPPYNKTVSHERAASVSTTEGGPNNGSEYPEEASALRVTRTALSPRGKESMDGGAMHAIYQHRTDNEVPRRLPVVVDDDRDDDRAANLSRSARTLRVIGTRFQGSPLRTRAMKKQRDACLHKMLDTSRNNLRRFTEGIH